MSVKREVDSKRREISSENLSMSVGEVLNLYKDSELDIHPEFQRVFRWVPQQKSRLIESLLLGIPLPPIYVAVNENGVWEVIDGVQRLSTIFEFMGELSGPASELDDSLILKAPLVLEGTKHLPSLAGIKYASMEQTLKLEFKRTRLDIKILEREKGGASTGKFDLFERLNTYGASLSPQEIRNCVLVSINAPLYRRLKELAENDSFIACTLLSDTQRSERYDMDLALRFITLRDIDPKQLGDVHDFLRDRMELLALDKNFDMDAEALLFSEMFEYLDESLGGDAFRPWNARLNAFRGAFSLAAFEGLGLALGRHWKQIRPISAKFDVLRVVKKIWNSEAYKKSFSGLRARERMARVMPVADAVVQEEINRVSKKPVVKRVVRAIKGSASPVKGKTAAKSSKKLGEKKVAVEKPVRKLAIKKAAR